MRPVNEIDRGHAAKKCGSAHENPIIVDDGHLRTTKVPDQVHTNHHTTFM
jgi:hypothetical protein